jgi:hypothetical protein
MLFMFKLSKYLFIFNFINKLNINNFFIYQFLIVKFYFNS